MQDKLIKIIHDNVTILNDLLQAEKKLKAEKKQCMDRLKINMKDLFTACQVLTEITFEEEQIKINFINRQP